MPFAWFLMGAAFGYVTGMLNTNYAASQAMGMSFENYMKMLQAGSKKNPRLPSGQ